MVLVYITKYVDQNRKFEINQPDFGSLSSSGEGNKYNLNLQNTASRNANFQIVGCLQLFLKITTHDITNF